ncbi:hypothetical protein PIB30_063041 [Stylosanthes scabra]|uniref:Uncharacterized protein n=1 Tax=Stylosanthes scabra TaxID=79078 RepID=A0ABU6VMB2_9FABA|nr:hypothetical protein [Stylosanthes scabra]
MQTPASQKVTTVAENEYGASNGTEDGVVVKGKAVDTNAKTMSHFVEEDDVADLNYDAQTLKEKEEVVLLGACMVGCCQGALWDRKCHAMATSLECLSRCDIDKNTRGCWFVPVRVTSEEEAMKKEKMVDLCTGQKLLEVGWEEELMPPITELGLP